MKTIPFLFRADGYKLGHHKQYPNYTQIVASNFTGRNGRDPLDSGVIALGLQGYLQRNLIECANETFFNRDLDEVLQEYGDFQVEYFGDESFRDTDHIEALWRLGYLPLEFRAVPEGTFVPYGVPMLTIINTYPSNEMNWVSFWVTNYIETDMSATLWLPCTSATTALKFRKIMNYWCNETGGDPDMVPFRGHDFSYRGMQGADAAMWSGFGHLTSFVGTDSIPSIWFAKEYYDAEGLVGTSVPATEHSVMCAGGDESELETFRRLLQIYPEGILSVVSDTWNLWDVLTKILPVLKDEIMSRNGTVVIRPDSGNPFKILCGDPEAPEGSPERLGVFWLLYNVFGGTKTSTGHIKLDSHVNVIYGDGINLNLCDGICKRLANMGFCPDLVFGVGSFTYTYVTRDTHGFAMKATYAVIDGQEKKLFKKPITDNGGKFSAKGLVAVEKKDNTLTLVDNMNAIELVEFDSTHTNELQLMWRNGKFVQRTTLDEIRARVAQLY